MGSRKGFIKRIYQDTHVFSIRFIQGFIKTPIFNLFGSSIRDLQDFIPKNKIQAIQQVTPKIIWTPMLFRENLFFHFYLESMLIYPRHLKLRACGKWVKPLYLIGLNERSQHLRKFKGDENSWYWGAFVSYGYSIHQRDLGWVSR